jgi:hypothetical protein
MMQSASDVVAETGCEFSPLTSAIKLYRQNTIGEGFGQILTTGNGPATRANGHPEHIRRFLQRLLVNKKNVLEQGLGCPLPNIRYYRCLPSYSPQLKQLP